MKTISTLHKSPLSNHRLIFTIKDGKQCIVLTEGLSGDRVLSYSEAVHILMEDSYESIEHCKFMEAFRLINWAWNKLDDEAEL